MEYCLFRLLIVLGRVQFRGIFVFFLIVYKAKTFQENLPNKSKASDEGLPMIQSHALSPRALRTLGRGMGSGSSNVQHIYAKYGS